MKKIGEGMDDADTAMVIVGLISIVAVVVLRDGAKEIALTAVGGILALARGRKTERKTEGGLPRFRGE